MRDSYGFGFGGMVLVFLLLLLVFGAAAALVAWLVTRGPHAPPGPAGPVVGGPPVNPARAMLDDRLARGEIDVAEYRERRAALEQAEPGPGVG